MNSRLGRALGMILLVCGLPAATAHASVYDGVPEYLLRADHEDMKAAFTARAQSIPAWVEGLAVAQINLLCLGETHSEWHRSFYAERVLPLLRFDRFLLEETPPALDVILRRFRAGEPVQLLGAPIGPVLAAATIRNPGVQFYGVESTQEQNLRVTRENSELGRGRLTRDAFIGLNTLAAIEPSGVAVALFGHSHCSRTSDGLGFDVPFFQLLDKKLASDGVRLTNVRLITNRDSMALRAVLQRYGILDRDPVALTRLRSMPPESYNYRLDFMALFSSFDTLLIAP